MPWCFVTDICKLQTCSNQKLLNEPESDIEFRGSDDESNTVLSFLIVIVVVNTIYSKCTQNLILVTLVIIYPTLTKFMQMSMLIVGNSLW